MRSLIVCCVAGAVQVAAVTAATAMKPAPASGGTLTLLAQAEQQKRVRGTSEQRVLQNPLAQRILRDPELQQQIMDDPRFESLMRDPQMQRLMQNPQLQRQLRENQQLRQLYQLQHRPLPGVTADDDDSFAASPSQEFQIHKPH
jgi:hypothetical protein